MMDPYQSPDDQASHVLEAMFTRLEDRGRNAKFLSMMHQYFGCLPRDRAVRLVDIGCGTGVVTREVRQHLHPDSKVIGMDISQQMIDKAQLLSHGMDIEWVVSTGQQLPYADQSFDAVIMHTLMSHVPDPVGMLREANRLLAPGGTAIIFDADYAGTTFAFPDLNKMRQTDFQLFKSIAANIDVCRQMPRYLREAGFQIMEMQPHVIAEAGKGDFWLSSVQGFARLIPSLNILPAQDGQEWVEHMLKSHEDGTFFASGNYYTFIAARREEST